MPFKSKDKERLECFRIFDDKEYREELNINNDMDIVRYFERHPEFDSITYLTVKNWRKKHDGSNSADNFQGNLAQMDAKALRGLKKSCEAGNAQALRLFYQLNNRLVEKREDTVKVEFTAGERIRIGRELWDDLIAEYRDTGHCPLCGFSKVLCDSACVDSEREHTEDREVATLALPS